MDEHGYISIIEASRKLGVSSYRIRRLCDSGYIPHIRRSSHYQRLLTSAQFELLTILVKMKQFGFTKSDIKRYAKLFRQGNQTTAERLAILTTRKHQLRNEIKAREAAIDFIEREEEIAQAKIKENL